MIDGRCGSGGNAKVGETKKAVGIDLVQLTGSLSSTKQRIYTRRPTREYDLTSSGNSEWWLEGQTRLLH